jgi:hypothetical protein
MPRLHPTPLADEGWLEKIIKQGRQMDSLGDLCRVEIDACEITPEKLETILQKRGLVDWKPVDIRPKTAARKAITRIRPELEEGDLRVIVRPVQTDDENEVRYAIVDETTDRHTASLDFSIRNQVVFNRELGTLTFTQDEVPEIRELFDYYCSIYTARELSMMVVSCIRKHGAVSFNDGSGFFFLPASLRDDVTEPLMSLVNGDLQEYKTRPKAKCYFRAIGILDSEQNRNTMGEALLAEITVELDDAEERLSDILTDERVSPRKVSAAVKRFQQAQGKAALYQDLLELNLDKITNRLRSAQRRATAALMEPAA